jgi:hypothetical protein
MISLASIPAMFYVKTASAARRFCTEAKRNRATDLSNSGYIATSSVFGYVWSIAMPAARGFDAANDTVALSDERQTKASVLADFIYVPEEPIGILRVRRV